MYRLVRSLASLAENPEDEIIQQDPELAIHWVVFCAQWPYTMTGLFQYLDDLEQKGTPPEASKLLSELLESARSLWQFDNEVAHQLDYDDDLRDRFLQVHLQNVTYETLMKLRRYTINFNPAVETEFKPIKKTEPYAV
jgi:hypothetical protein